MKAAGGDDRVLIVAGEFYTDKAPYLEQIERLGIGGSVILHDSFIPDDMVSAYFSASDMVVQPYKTATQSGVTQIAYHFGLPMIVTPVGGLPEIVPDGVAGYVVEPEGLAEAMERCFDSRTNSRLRESVATERAKFSWERMSRAVLTGR